MAWRFQRSIKAGPFRVNLGKSGVGVSVGARGFRTGIRASGRRYTSVSIPGTGVRITKGARKGSGCLVVLMGWALLFIVVGMLL